ncbi:MAG TPA: MarP family serine protease [Gaiellaceae bacterium]|nr:MarP family serine protease [Gaiellaceae bacterium]
MTRLDWIVLALVAVTALLGLWQGLVISALSAVGVIVGGVIGARVAPHLLPDGSESPYTPLVALLGAAGFAVLFEIFGSSIGVAIRRRLPVGPLRTADSAGGFAFGALAGLALVWIAAAVALQLPGQRELRREVQGSAILSELNELVPPRRALRALARVDPFPSIAGPAPPVGPPDPSVLREPEIRRAARSVVRVVGTACGLGLEGSGWVAANGLVVTNAHVVAGETDTAVDRAGSAPLAATPVAFDARNDVAVLRVPGLKAPPLAQAEPRIGTAGAVLGYPDNGPLTARPARVGRTTAVLSVDAYGRGPVARRITSLRGDVRPGNSGGPLLDASGRVVGTVFAARIEGEAGYAVPPDAVDDAVADARDGQPVSTGDCVG